MTHVTNSAASAAKAIAVSETTASDGQSVAAPGESLLPDPIAGMMLSDDAIYQIAALVAQSAGDARKAARAQRNAQEQRFEAETARRVSALRERADAMRTAAMISGVTGMAAGACQVTGGAMSLSAAAKLETSAAPDELVRWNQGEQNKLLSTQASAYNQIGSGLGGALQGAGTAASGLLNAESEDLMTDATAHEARAQRAQRQAEQHSDEMEDAKRLQDKVMEFLSDVRASQNSARQSAIRG